MSQENGYPLPNQSEIEQKTRVRKRSKPKGFLQRKRFYQKLEEGDVLSDLTPRERDVIISRWQQGSTLESIGGGFNVTRERIRQIEQKARRKILKSLTNCNIREIPTQFRADWQQLKVGGNALTPSRPISFKRRLGQLMREHEIELAREKAEFMSRWSGEGNKPIWINPDRNLPNKFADDLGPFGTVSRLPDQDGLHRHKVPMSLIGLVTYRAPHIKASFEGAVDFRKMNKNEVEQYLQEIDVIYKNSLELPRFVRSVKKRLGIV